MAIRRKTKRHTSRKKRPRTTKKRSNPPLNVQAQIKAFRALERRTRGTWSKLQRDVKRQNIKAIRKGRAELMLLLGECKYMADEYQRCLQKAKRKR